MHLIELLLSENIIKSIKSCMFESLNSRILKVRYIRYIARAREVPCFAISFYRKHL